MIGLTALLAAVIANHMQRTDLLGVMAAMQSEAWYRISLSGQHVGYMATDNFQDHHGAFHFKTTTHFQLADGEPNTIFKHLQFAPSPPHQLIHAEYRSEQAGQQTSVVAQPVVETASGGYQLRVTRQQRSNQLELDWQFGLSDLLAFETWLARGPRSAGASHTVKNLDFDRLQLTKRAFQVVDHNDTGYLVQTNSPFAATTTQLDRRYSPVHLKMAGLFDIALVDEAQAVPTRKIEAKRYYLFPLDQRLPDHTSISALTLKAHPPLPTVLPNPLRLSANSVPASTRPEDYLGESLDTPVSAAEVKSLLTRLDPQLDRVDALVELTYQTLRYEEGKPAGSVLAALSRGFGECTDFADLLTTLARAAHIPARTVYGLAYKDGSSPSLMFHAWNHLYDGSRWRSVDPTWGQRRADATHIHLTDGQAARLMHALNTQGLRFEVVDFSYQ